MDRELAFKYDPLQLEYVGVPIIVLKNFRQLNLKPSEWSLYCVISYLQSEGKRATQDEIAQIIGVSSRQTKSILANMKKKGLLKVERNGLEVKYDFRGLIEKAKQIEKSGYAS